LSPSGQKVARGHLRVAYTPHQAAKAPSRAALHVCAMLVRLRIYWLNLLALLGAFVALAPLVLRQGPLWHRRVVQRRAARVILMPERRQRRASPP
jgi:DNA mismatch repair protein MutH